MSSLTQKPYQSEFSKFIRDNSPEGIKAFSVILERAAEESSKQQLAIIEKAQKLQ
ncbi:MAG: hypothetical protein ACI9TY_001068 [Alphaproteobacteria bacterium]|jgi:hypothetical protein